MLVGVAELAEEIDVDRARVALEGAEARVAELAGCGQSERSRIGGGGRTRPRAGRGRSRRAPGPGPYRGHRRVYRSGVDADLIAGRISTGDTAERDPVRGAGVPGESGPTFECRFRSAEFDGAVLGQLVERVLGIDEPDRAGLRPHDQRLGGGAELVVAHPMEQFAVGDTGGGEEAVVPLDQVIGGEDGVEVVAGGEGGLALAFVARPEAALGSRRPST